MNIRKQLPALDVTAFEDAPCFIVAFYKQLGWNPDNQALDPRLIKMHPEMWNYLCEQLIALGGRAAGLSWMNFGPAADENGEYRLDKHEIKILKGAFTVVSKRIHAC